MPSILIFCKTLLKGGAEKQALFLSKLLLGENVDICLVNWCGDQIDAENLKFIQLNSVKYFPLKGGFLVKFYRYLKILRNEKISISVSYLTLPNFVSGMSKFFYSRILTVGGIRNENISYYKFLFEKWIHNRLNNATVFNNYSARDKFVKRGFKSEKIYVIHNAIEVPALINKPVVSGNELYIISVSRFVKQKDFHTALYSFNRLLQMGNNENLIYYIVGYGPLEQDIRLLVKNLGIESQVKILINPKNIPDILRSCDVYLSTSLFEGLPNSIMEAMAVGLPIVATDVGDNKYLVREGLNGYLLPCKDIEQIAEKLQHLLKSENERKEFGENSYNFIKDNFTQEKLLNSYLELFSKITSNKIF